METITPPARDQRDLLRTIAEGTAGTVGAAFLRSLSRCLAAAFAADVAYVAELSADHPPTSGTDPRVLAGRRRAARGLRVRARRHAVRADRRRRRHQLPDRQRRALPARRLPRPPRARGLPRGADARHVRRARRVRLRALPRPPRRGGRGARRAPHLRRPRGGRARAPPPRGDRCARARSRSPPRAPGCCTPPTRSAAGSAATSTTARSSAWSCSASASTSRCAPGRARPARERAADGARPRAGARSPGSELRELARGLHPAGLERHGLAPVAARARRRRSDPAAARRAARAAGCPTRSRSPSTTSSPRRSRTPSSTRGATELRVARRAARPVPPRRGRRRRRRRRGGGRGQRPRRPRRPASRRSAAGSRSTARPAPARGCAPRSRSRRGATAASRSSSSATRATAAPASAQIAADHRRRQDGLGLARPRVGPRGRPAADRPAAPDHRPPRRAPRTVEVTRVAVLPFGQIDGATVSAESAGTATLEEWIGEPPRVLRGLPRRDRAAARRARLAPDRRRADGRHVVPLVAVLGAGHGAHLVDRREAGLEAAPRGAQVDLPDAHALGPASRTASAWLASSRRATRAACARSPSRKPSTWRVSKPARSSADWTRERCSGAASGNT